MPNADINTASVWKFTLAETDDKQPLLMPFNARIIHVHEQGDQVAIWAIVNPKARLENRWFIVVGTGQDMPEDNEYLGTCHVGRLVLHVFETVSS